MAKMGEGHLLTAEEMAIIEKAEEEEEEGLFVEGEEADPQAAADDMAALKAAEDDVSDEFIEELMARMQAGHLLDAKEMAILEASGGGDDEDE